MSLSRLKQIAILLFAFCPIVVLAQAPTPTDLYMTGVMKVAHTVTINFTYSDPQGGAEPQTGVEYQWFEHDDELDVTGTAIPAATGVSLVLGSTLAGKMVSCQVRVRNAVDGFGPWVEFKPWDAANPNPVLDNNTSCFTAGTTSADVNFSLSSNTSTFLCSPRTVEYTITYTGINYSTTPVNSPPKIIIDWGDGITETFDPTEVDPRETNQAKKKWTTTRQHVYDYDIPGRLVSAVVGERCTYTIRFAHGYGGNICPGGTSQTAKVTVWDREDNASLGSFDIAHDPTSAGVEAVPPAPLPASTENVNVCENDTSPVRLQDNTDFNCTPPLEASVPNAQGRWMQWIYGTTSTINAPGGATGSIIINGVSYSAAQLPVYGRPVWVDDPFVGPSAVITDDIRMPVTASSGQQFFITLRSWNECNRFDRVISDNCGLNPTQGVGFDNFPVYAGATTIQASSQYNAALQACQPALTLPFFAFSTPVEREYTITITDKPDKPVAADKVVCNAENTTANRTIAVSPTVGGLTYRWYASRADALSNSSMLFAGSSFAIPAGLVSAAGVHDFFVTAFAASGCVSDPDTVYFTRRASVGTISITGPEDVCPGGTYAYRVSPFNNATPLTPGGGD